jgi:polyisoprenoid-binding protein YceI
MINFRSRFVFASIVIFATQVFALPRTYQFQPENGQTVFLAVGRPSAIKIRGEGKGASGLLTLADGRLNGRLKMNVESFSTGIDMRDHHMKEKYLEVAKFPNAELELSDIKIGDSPVKNFPFAGQLTLKGVKKAVAGEVTTSGTPDQLHVEATFHLKLSDFKIEIPTYLGISVAEDVSVTVQSEIESK